MSGMRLTMTGPWKKVLSNMKQLDRGVFKDAVIKSIAQEAVMMEGLVAKGFKVQGLHRPWKKLSPITLAFRKKAGFAGTKILQSSNSLRRSAIARKTGIMTWFVGVHRSARSSDGKKLVNIAAVHEGPFPTIVPVTKKMRGFWMAMFLQGVVKAPLKKNRAVIVIMPRPFLKPAFDKMDKGSGERMVNRIKVFMQAQGIKF